MNIIKECQRLLQDAHIDTDATDAMSHNRLSFESATVIGFVFSYDSVDQLLERWASDVKLAIDSNQLALRRAALKTWNVYIVLLSQSVSSDIESVSLSAIEEDLIGTRKIARSGVTDIKNLRAALLSLLPIQNAPRLEEANMPDEIRLRTTELPPRVIEAFLSDASEAVVAQVFEDSR